MHMHCTVCRYTCGQACYFPSIQFELRPLAWWRLSPWKPHQCRVGKGSRPVARTWVKPRRHERGVVHRHFPRTAKPRVLKSNVRNMQILLIINSLSVRYSLLERTSLSTILLEFHWLHYFSATVDGLWTMIVVSAGEFRFRITFYWSGIISTDSE
jgi:hypothetical protein